jgi:hypothetical protein
VPVDPKAHRHLVVDDHRGGVFGGAGDRDHVAQGVEGRARLHGIADDEIAHGAGHQRIAVGLGLEYLAQADEAIGAGLVLDNDRLVELEAQALGHQPRGQVGDTGGRERNDQPDRTRGE